MIGSRVGAGRLGPLWVGAGAGGMKVAAASRRWVNGQRMCGPWSRASHPGTLAVPPRTLHPVLIRGRRGRRSMVLRACPIYPHSIFNIRGRAPLPGASPNSPLTNNPQPGAWRHPPPGTTHKKAPHTGVHGACLKLCVDPRARSAPPSGNQEQPGETKEETTGRFWHNHNRPGGAKENLIHLSVPINSEANKRPVKI